MTRTTNVISILVRLAAVTVRDQCRTVRGLMGHAMNWWVA